MFCVVDFFIVAKCYVFVCHQHEMSPYSGINGVGFALFRHLEAVK